jgi:hypothetical protein
MINVLLFLNFCAGPYRNRNCAFAVTGKGNHIYPEIRVAFYGKRPIKSTDVN